jgi:enterochelin esterase-like enzyme
VVGGGGAPGKADALPRASGEVRELTWRFDESPVGDMRVVVVVPREAGPSRKLPVLVTMHGQGEALKGPAKGARGWVDDYWLPTALRRLSAPPLTESDFRNRFSDARLGLLNSALAARPYQGLIVVCPYTPHKILKGKAAFTEATRLADFLVDEVLPRVYEETPAIGSAETTAVDGVSLGGRAALLVGLARPEAFGALGALQPAFDVEDAPRLAVQARKAREKNPRMALRLLTSEGDYYLASTRAISQAMNDAGVRHSLDVVPGDHSYDFNRGPGVYEMLLFHDRALRGVPHVTGEGT